MKRAEQVENEVCPGGLTLGLEEKTIVSIVVNQVNRFLRGGAPPETLLIPRGEGYPDVNGAAVIQALAVNGIDVGDARSAGYPLEEDLGEFIRGTVIYPSPNELTPQAKAALVSQSNAAVEGVEFVGYGLTHIIEQRVETDAGLRVIGVFVVNELVR